jgi:hypothetical protein
MSRGDLTEQDRFGRTQWLGRRPATVEVVGPDDVVAKVPQRGRGHLLSSRPGTTFTRDAK